ncbi:MAG: zinc ribbon domain-containing protein [Methanomassiliicoccaceae archaeon]|nr:zinc ribbon domain-containing protein [Methanomassiliicoccaceae archaeon]
MTSDRENYCRLIGLNPLKESSYTYDAIEKKIAAKESKWTKESKDKQNDLDRRFQIGKWLDMVPEMRRVMKDPALRSREFEDGKKILKSKASRLNRDSIILHDGSRVLLPGTAENLVKKLQWDGISKDDLINLAGIKKTSVPPVVSEKVISAFKGLQEVHAFTPMDVLNDLIKNPDLEININPLDEGSTLTQIRSAFDSCEKRVNSVRQEILPNQDSYIQTLRSLKLLLSSDQDLSNLVKYGKCMRILGPAKLMMDEDYGQPFTREYIDEIINKYIRHTNADSSMAISILEEYCVKKKYLSNFSSKESKLTTCSHCGALVESGDNIMYCSVCGGGIRTKCPQCGTGQASGNRACMKCGFDFQDGLNKAKELEKKFRIALSYGMIDEAANCITKIERTYSTYPSLQEMKNELKPLSSKYNELINSIDLFYKQRKYYALRSAVDDAKLDFTKILNNPEIERKYEEASQKIIEADNTCDRAASSKDQSNAMMMYVTAIEMCPDHPIAKAKMKEHPPESPADAVAQVREGKVLLKFAVPEDRAGMTFCIFRGKDSLPVVTDDSTPLAEIPGSVYLDKTTEPGIDTYYAVYSKRWGILSREAASCGPVMVFKEVEVVSIEPIEGGLRIIYEKPKGASKVRIWRKEGTSAAGVGEEVEIMHGGETVIDDYGLKGGVKYYYLLVAEYKNKGRTERSMGNVVSFTTTKFPEPIRDMEIRWNKADGSFTAKWKSKERVSLYSSPNKVNLFGRMVKLDDLNAWMKEIQPLEAYENGMRFLLPDGAVQYIYPMIPAGKVAVRGKEILVANLKPFRDVEKRMSGNDCDVTMTWPMGADSAILAIKESAAASGPDDLDAERITITRDAYNKDKMVRIPMGNSKKRTVTLYAVYDVSGERMTSRGMSIDIYSGASSKVRYSMTLEGSSKAESKVILSIDTDSGTRELPPMTAIAVQDGIPLKIWDGESIWSSNRPVALNSGRATIMFTVKTKVDISKVRLFFVNEEDYNLFKFIHPLYKEK